MFSWSRAFYYALRWSAYGAASGFVLGLLVAYTGGPAAAAFGFPIILFPIFGLCRLFWELLTKRHPHA